MNTASLYCRFLGACAAGLCLAGCSGITPRTFVLTPVQALPATGSLQSSNVVVGIRPVKVAGYLATKGFAVRKNGNEIVYPETMEWAERPDTALQQMLGANLATLIPTDQVRFSLWDPESVSVQVEVNVARFDVDSRGEAVLVAWWRLLSPDGQKVFASGRFSSTRKGPSPSEDVHGAVSSMSSLVADFAAMLAQTIKQHTTL